MNKKQVMGIVKKLTAGVLAVGMIVAGMIAYPKQADAAVVEDKVIYVQDDTNYNINNYWNADSTKRTAPVKEGYVFGGWFKAANAGTEGAEQEADTENYYAPLTESELNEAVPERAFAKFVPAQVLSVKAQNESKVTKDYITNFTDVTDSFYVRVMTSLDSTNYQKVGFDIYLGNWKKVYKEGTTDEPTETTKIYRGVEEGTETKHAEDIFGGVSRYVSVWQLSEINYKENVSLIIYVRPYWVTTDGTTVNGLAKYVHIEDEYLGYINVPINLLGGEDIAAGAVKVTYSGAEAGSLELVAFEKGRIFTSMECDYDDTGNTVKMVGNTDLTVGNYDENGETIYANLRFKAPTVSTEFNIVNEGSKFCNWEEQYIDVKKVWDTKYVP